MARGVGGGGRLFVGDDYFKYFQQRGVIIRGRRSIEGRLLCEEIRYTHQVFNEKFACNSFFCLRKVNLFTFLYFFTCHFGE